MVDSITDNADSITDNVLADSITSNVIEDTCSITGNVADSITENVDSITYNIDILIVLQIHVILCQN